MELDSLDSPFHPLNRSRKDGALQPEQQQHDEQVPWVIRFAANHVLFMKPLNLQWTIIASIKSILPFTSNITKDHIFIISACVVLLLSILFAIVFSIGYNDALNTTYLSPLNVTNYEALNANVGSYCQTVQTTNTGTYLATISGYWQNSPLFVYSNASFYIDVTSFSLSFNDYETLMGEVYMFLERFGEEMATQSLTFNLVVWTTGMLVVPNENSQRFYMSGDPKVIFNRQHTVGVLTSLVAPCYFDNVSYSSSYNSNNGRLALDYSYQQYINNPVCMKVTSPTTLGYISIADGDNFLIDLDVQSVLTAMSVNFGVLSMTDLVEIPDTLSRFLYNGMNFSISTFYSPKSPSMQPLTCMENEGFNVSMPLSATNVFLCGSNFGQLYVVPIFNHAGSNYSVPRPCDCQFADSYGLNSSYAPCNLFNFISGFVFWNTELPTPIFEVLARVNFDYRKFNEMAFNASFIDSYWGLSSPQYDELHSDEYRAASYSFCNTSLGVCSMVLFSSFDGAQSTWSISDYYFLLQHGACRNTLTPSLENWYVFQSLRM
jgi:hypothetical protein